MRRRGNHFTLLSLTDREVMSSMSRLPSKLASAIGPFATDNHAVLNVSFFIAGGLKVVDGFVAAQVRDLDRDTVGTGLRILR